MSILENRDPIPEESCEAKPELKNLRITRYALRVTRAWLLLFVLCHLSKTYAIGERPPRIPNYVRVAVIKDAGEITLSKGISGLNL